MITNTIKKIITDALRALGIDDPQIHLEHPTELSHGDYATNVAMRYAKELDMNPRALAESILEKISKNLPNTITSVDIAGPGFINFHLSDDFFKQSLAEILDKKDHFGKIKYLLGKKVMTEFTDPNPFKLLHIGHVMSNTIGESLSRLCVFSGADVRWSNYQGDVGMHVAKAIWGIVDLGGREHIAEDASLKEKVSFLGKAYAHGATKYKAEEHVEEMKSLNKAIYERSDEDTNKLYDWGRSISLEYFEVQYKRLGTYHNLEEDMAFHFYNFESQVAAFGTQVVRDGLRDGIFIESERAIIFEGEKYGLHNRVFINSLGLPTYEAKELGLAKVKYDQFPYDMSIIITANEINEYFKVLLKAMSLTFPELAAKTTHIGHGMMKLTTGKMSSRTGDVIVAEDLLDGMEERVLDHMEGREGGDKLVSSVAIAAVKFAILKQDTRKDIVFDPETSLSFEGDSGPYLQYTHARCRSIIAKAGELNQDPSIPREIINIDHLLYRFPEVIELATREYAPHHVANYLLELSRAFNSWYGNIQIIVDGDEPGTAARVQLVQAVATTIKNGLWVLGIDAPEKM
jgi:arginyl-tRNA synthetase